MSAPTRSSARCWLATAQGLCLWWSRVAGAGRQVWPTRAHLLVAVLHCRLLCMPLQGSRQNSAAGRPCGPLPCTLMPPPAMHVCAGFPVRALPPSLPGYTARVAAGIDGADLNCPGSIEPGVCAFPSPVDAAAVCAALPECRAVTFLAEGALSEACCRKTMSASCKFDTP